MREIHQGHDRALPESIRDRLSRPRDLDALAERLAAAGSAGGRYASHPGLPPGWRVDVVQGVAVYSAKWLNDLKP
jgi:hypothetical protein